VDGRAGERGRRPRGGRRGRDYDAAIPPPRSMLRSASLEPAARPPTGRRAAVGIAVLLGVASCSDPGAGPAKLAGRGQVPTIRALRASGPIAVDGRLDEPAWKRALEVPLVNSLDGSTPRWETVARVLWDERNLYVAFEARDDRVFVRPGRRDGDAIWEDEVVEVFVDPTGTGRGYSEVDVSPANVRFEARFEYPRSDLAAARSWRSGAVTAARVDRDAGGDRGFVVEMAIPLESVRGAAAMPRPGDRWRVNLYRLETRNGAGVLEGQAFSPPLRPDFHSPDRFGWLVFDGGP